MLGIPNQGDLFGLRSRNWVSGVGRAYLLIAGDRLLAAPFQNLEVVGEGEFGEGIGGKPTELGQVVTRGCGAGNDRTPVDGEDDGFP